MLFNDGYVTIYNFVKKNHIVQIKQNVDRLVLKYRNNREDQCPRVYKDDYGHVIVINRIELADIFFYDLARETFLLELGRKLLGKPIIPLSVELFSKPPRSSLVTPPHQDQIFYEEHFNDEMAITFWIALDDMNENNGSLEYSVPKELELLPHKESESPGFSFELDPNCLDNLPTFKKAIIPKGGCIVHHAYAVHKAKGNTTDSCRNALALTYRTSSYRAAYAV